MILHIMKIICITKVRPFTPTKSKKDVQRPGDFSPRLSHEPSRKSNTSQVSLLSDLSPSRKKQKESILESAKDKRKPGLISGKDIREEIDRTKKDDWLRFKQMDSSISGRGAVP